MIVLHKSGVTYSGVGCGVHRMIICARRDEAGALARNVNLVHHGLKSATKEIENPEQDVENKSKSRPFPPPEEQLRSG